MGGGEITAACSTNDTPLSDHYLLPAPDGQPPADGALTTNEMTRRVVLKAAESGKHLPLVLGVIFKPGVEPRGMVAAVNATYDVLGRATKRQTVIPTEMTSSYLHTHDETIRSCMCLRSGGRSGS